MIMIWIVIVAGVISISYVNDMKNKMNTKNVENLANSYINKESMKNIIKRMYS